PRASSKVGIGKDSPRQDSNAVAMPQTNLPEPLTSFIGREQEIAEAISLLGRSRLLTLTGTGGVGKSRLALQVAGEVLEDYRDGVWLVELASMADAGLVSQTVASALGVSGQVGKSFMQTLIEHLRARRLLLVLDNCEHLLWACVQFSDTLLRSCPHLKI